MLAHARWPAPLHWAGLATASLLLLACEPRKEPTAEVDPKLTPTEALNAEYDRQTFEIMRRTLKGEATGIDVGSFKGDMLAQMVTCAPNGTHYGFEPLPEFYEITAERFPSPKVKVFQLALGDETGTATFTHVVSNPAYSGFKERSYTKEETLQTIEVTVEKLDNVLPPKARVDFMKVDVEGAELQVLQGARETIKRAQPVIVFEFGSGSSGRYGTTPQKMWAYLHDELGMHLSLMQRWLDGEDPFRNLEEFEASSTKHFYFIAYPPVSRPPTAP